MLRTAATCSDSTNASRSEITCAPSKVLPALRHQGRAFAEGGDARCVGNQICEGLSVVLGFCESHWETSGQRPMICHVEGAPAQPLDCIAKWGQHQPGALQFAAKDQNGDGELTISVLPQPGPRPESHPERAMDFRRRPKPGPRAGHSGTLNAQALHYLDVGGANDQSLYAGGQAEYVIQLPPKSAQEMTFLVACTGGSIPTPERTAWTPEKLRQSAAQVWREWKDTR
jgi:hypothetical protein